ncbi:Gfo/Idh/MocA family oxidoreductase [Allokutzneria oryzae]|uniref:Gfo/Idh/MocA family oxidoreductase n=1 Tax=Allokutzneria oryzae TaxID=1378989 RepID=A0ABV5ZVE9_9PSEU
MTSSLRAALVGYGLGGSAFHAPFLASTPGLVLGAVVTGNPERQTAARDRYPGTEVIGSLDELLTRADEFDLAVVTTPNRHHAANATALLEHGLPVVVDKPFAASLDDARALRETARSRNLMLAPFHNRRYDGDFLTVQRLLNEGRLGRALRFESRFERWRPDASVNRKEWKENADPANAGGITFDLGSHLIDQAVVLFGRPTHVHAEVLVRRETALVDDDVFIALTHDNGVRSHLWMSAIAADLGPRFRVLGDKAYYVKYGLDPQENALRAGEIPGGPGWGEEPESEWGRVGADRQSTVERTDPGAYQQFWSGIVTALRTNTPPPVTADDGVTVLEVIEAAYRAQASGRQEIPPVG